MGVLKSNNGYDMNNYRSKKFGDKFLVTTDHGSWILLEEKDFESMKKEELLKDSELFRILEDKGIILTDKNKDKIIDLLKKRYNYLFQGTSLHIIIPTLRCNHKCVYCHASSMPLGEKDYDMDEETAKATVDFIFQSPSKDIIIEFQGGEPLLRFDLIKLIVEYAKKVNEQHKKCLNFNIVTNFSLMDEDKLEYIIKNGLGVCTSLDGHAYLHDKNRPITDGVGSHRFVEKWIRRLNEEYDKMGISDIKVNALITITRESLKYPKEIIDEYLRLGLNEIHLRFLNNIGDARPVWKDISYSPDEFIDFWEKCLDYILEKNKDGSRIRERIVTVMLRKILTDMDPNYLDLRSPCGAAIGQLAYTQKGDIFSCDEARMIDGDLFKLGNVKKNNYKDILNSEKTCNLVSSSINDCHICDFCAYKPYCGICPVCNFAEQGSIIAKIPETPRCKIYKAQFTYIFNKLQCSEDNKVLMSWLEEPEKNRGDNNEKQNKGEDSAD